MRSRRGRPAGGRQRDPSCAGARCRRCSARRPRGSPAGSGSCGAGRARPRTDRRAGSRAGCRFGAAPAIEQLIVVAGDDERPVRRTAAGSGEALQQHELRVIGVLELVDEDVAPAAPVATANRRIAREQRDAVGDEIGEVKRVGCAQLGLHVLPDRRDPCAVRVLRALAQVLRRPETALGERDLRERLLREVVPARPPDPRP